MNEVSSLSSFSRNDVQLYADGHRSIAFFNADPESKKIYKSLTSVVKDKKIFEQVFNI